MGRRYRLTSRLEESALSELYRGTAEGPGAGDILVKLYNPKVSDFAFAKALAEVAARTRALGHPLAAAYDEVGMVQGRIAAVRPYVDGFNLGDAMRRLMSKEVVLPPAVALYIVAEAANVLAAAHARGWIHGAVTPGNIIVARDGRVRVADFGALEAMNASPALKALASKGRHAYRAPELSTGNAGSPASDVYSLGAIAYELVTLREVAAARGGGLSTKRDALPPPSRIDRRLNARIDPPMMRALDPAATRRFKNAQDFSEAMRGLFTVLGYAPSQREVSKFVADLFPNEVSIGGSSEVAIEGPFTLDEIRAETTYSAPELPVFADERASFTSLEIPAVQTPVAAPVPVAVDRPKAQTFEEWDAPPGQMPDAPKLNRSRGRVEPEPAPAPIPSEPEVTVAPPRPDRNGSAPKPRPQRKPAVVDRAATDQMPSAILDTPFDDEALAPRRHDSTEHDWHPPPPVPDAPAPKVRVGVGAWLVAGLTCVAFAGVAYLMVGKKLGRLTSEPIEVNTIGHAPAPVPAFEDPKPKPTPAPRTGTRAAATGIGYLTLSADAPAAVFIDGADLGKKLPLDRYELDSGPHTVMLVGDDGTAREFKVDVTAGQETTRTESLKKPAPKPAQKTTRTAKKTTRRK